MTYELVRDGLLSVLKEVAGQTGVNTRYEDYEPLNGGNQQAIIVRYNGFAATRDSFGRNSTRNWRFAVELYVAYVDDVTSRTAEDTFRQRVLVKLKTKSDLNATPGVLDSWVNDGMPNREPAELGAAKFLKETLNIVVMEDIDDEAEE